MTDPIRLTSLAGSGGCSAKIGQADLAEVLAGIATPVGGALLVGALTGDDAAVWRCGPELALIATCDFFPPPVDDPRDYGAVATANALSDVYAMGGEPALLLNLVGYDLARWPPHLLAAILAGGAAVAAEAGCAVAGGHSIRSAEPLFGCAVIGTAHPDRLITNAGARPGDRLLLTKPLGTGVILNALRQDAAPPRVLAAAVASMRRLNRDAGRACVTLRAHAATDITGFGLLGHAGRMALESGVGLRITAERVPLLPGALALARRGLLPGGSRRNLELNRATVAVAGTVSPEREALAADAQTSGGLLVVLPADAVAPYQRLVPEAVEIGEVTEAAEVGGVGRIALA